MANFNSENTWKAMDFPKMGYPQIETFYSEGSVFGNEHNS